MEWGDPLTLAKKATSADGQKKFAKIKQSKRLLLIPRGPWVNHWPVHGGTAMVEYPGNMQPCEKSCATDQFALFSPKKHSKQSKYHSDY